MGTKSWNILIKNYTSKTLNNMISHKPCIQIDILSYLLLTPCMFLWFYLQPCRKMWQYHLVVCGSTPIVPEHSLPPRTPVCSVKHPSYVCDLNHNHSYHSQTSKGRHCKSDIKITRGILLNHGVEVLDFLLSFGYDLYCWGKISPVEVWIPICSLWLGQIHPNGGLHMPVWSNRPQLH